MQRHSEVHGLNSNSETVKILKSNANYKDFETLCSKPIKGVVCIAFISFKTVNGKKFMAVREKRYK